MNESAGTREQIRVLGTHVDTLSLEEAIAQLMAWLEQADADRQAPCRYVVTPNLDHAVQLETNLDLRASYAGASMVLPDGMPLVWASRLGDQALRERVPGSALTPQLLKAAGSRSAPLAVFLLGASPETSRMAAAKVEAGFPGIEVVGRLSPPRGFEHSSVWSDTIVARIQESGARLVLVGLGAPKQELWVHRHAARLEGTVVLCVGATLDFLAGRLSRAPVWAQKSGLEWAHRMLSEPRRLVGRYAHDALHLPLLLAKDMHWRRRQRRSSHRRTSVDDTSPGPA